MRRLWTSLALILGLSLLFAHNNCDVTPQEVMEDDWSSLGCFGEDCLPGPNSSGLWIASERQFSVWSNEREFRFNGDCGLGHFDQAVIFWELRNPEGRVINRFSPENYDCRSRQPAETLCGRTVDGKFSLRVWGWGSSLYAQHQVRLNIVGFDKDCRPYESGLDGQIDVFLTPLGGS